MGEFLLLSVIIVGICFVCKVWIRALTSILATEDDQFPGRHDKILWVVIFLCAPVFAPFMYIACVERVNQKRSS